MSLTPCPHRIIDDMGQAYCMGFCGGSVWHAIKGYRQAPRGFANRSYGIVRNVQRRGPVLGGNFAVWGLSFSCWDCIFQHTRKKDDAMNAIAAGFMTGGMLAWRAGWRSAFKNACIGGVLLAMIEGMSISLGKMMAPADPNMQGSMSPYSTHSGPGGAKGGTAPPPPQAPTSWDDDVNDFDFDFDVSSSTAAGGSYEYTPQDSYAYDSSNSEFVNDGAWDGDEDDSRW